MSAETSGERRHVNETHTPHRLEDVKSDKGFKLIHMNVRSLLQKRDEVDSCFLDGAFDAVVLTETWLHQNVSDTLISNPMYICTRLDRQVTTPSGVTKTGGGICVYTKKELTFEVIKENSSSDGHLELLHVVLRLRHQKDVHIIGVYRPPTGNVEIMEISILIC